MASGLLGFLGFGKKSKPNLVPDIMPPSATDSPLYGQLKDFAANRIKAGTTGEETPGVGFGPDFVSKTSNPAIAQIDANFRDRTLPTISNEASKRGLARSSIVADQIGRADLQRSRDIDSMVADFYKLNEIQKKSDITEGVNVGNTLDTQYLNQGNQQAAESAKIRDLTLGVANTNNANDLKRQNQVIGSMMNMVVPGSGTAFAMNQNQPTSSQTDNTKLPSASANVQSTGIDDNQLAEIEAYLKSKGLIK